MLFRSVIQSKLRWPSRPRRLLGRASRPCSVQSNSQSAPSSLFVYSDDGELTLGSLGSDGRVAVCSLRSCLTGSSLSGMCVTPSMSGTPAPLPSSAGPSSFRPARSSEARCTTVASGSRPCSIVGGVHSAAGSKDASASRSAVSQVNLSAHKKIDHVWTENAPIRSSARASA